MSIGISSFKKLKNTHMCKSCQGQLGDSGRQDALYGSQSYGST